MPDDTAIDTFIAHWRETGGSELANTQSFINGLRALIGTSPPDGSRTDNAFNDYVFERRLFQNNGDGTESFGRINAYKRGCFILEAKQGSEGDRAALEKGQADVDIFGQRRPSELSVARPGTATGRRALRGMTRLQR